MSVIRIFQLADLYLTAHFEQYSMFPQLPTVQSKQPQPSSSIVNKQKYVEQKQLQNKTETNLIMIIRSHSCDQGRPRRLNHLNWVIQ